MHALNHLYDGCIFLKECVIHLTKTVKCARRVYSPNRLLLGVRIGQLYIIASDVVEGV